MAAVRSLRRRVRLWVAAAAACAILAVGLRAFWLEPASLTVSEERITLRSSAHGSLRIAILTDLHVGSGVGGQLTAAAAVGDWQRHVCIVTPRHHRRDPSTRLRYLV